MKKECIILAGGQGTRLRSVVSDVPKCMATVAGVPFLQHIFDYLEQQNVDHIVLALGYKAEIIIGWLKKQKRNFDISYIIEEEALGTGGAIKFAFSKIRGDKTLVLNGDTFFNIETDRLFAFHNNKEAKISLALKPMVNFDRYGSVECDSDERIIQFNEKRYVKSGLINAGVYLIERSTFSEVKLPEKFSFEKSILEVELSSLPIYGCPFNNYFIDIGIPTDYEKANIDFKNKNFD